MLMMRMCDVPKIWTKNIVPGEIIVHWEDGRMDRCDGDELVEPLGGVNSCCD
jgi:hypothetical protein